MWLRWAGNYPWSPNFPSRSRLTFDAETGRRLAAGEEQLMSQLDTAQTAFRQLRFQWHEGNQALRTDAGQRPIQKLVMTA